jgi:hypothetical protein
MGKQFSKDYQPKGRGKSERNKILDAMKRIGQTEDGFYDLLVERASNPEDTFTYKELLSRMSPIPKAVAPCVNFEFNDKGSLSEQSAQVLSAIAKGELAPDLGGAIINSISSMVKIKEVTDIEERLQKMEKEVESSK